MSNNKYNPDKNKTGVKPLDEENHSHRSQDDTSRWPMDQELRRWGFSIYKRDKNSTAVWLRDHEFYTQEQAIDLLEALKRSFERHGE